MVSFLWMLMLPSISAKCSKLGSIIIIVPFIIHTVSIETSTQARPFCLSSLTFIFKWCMLPEVSTGKKSPMAWNLWLTRRTQSLMMNDAYGGISSMRLSRLASRKGLAPPPVRKGHVGRQANSLWITYRVHMPKAWSVGFLGRLTVQRSTVIESANLSQPKPLPVRLIRLPHWIPLQSWTATISDTSLRHRRWDYSLHTLDNHYTRAKTAGVHPAWSRRVRTALSAQAGSPVRTTQRWHSQIPTRSTVQFDLCLGHLFHCF